MTRLLLTVMVVATLTACAAGSHPNSGARAAAPALPPLSQSGCIPGGNDSSYPEEARSQGLYGITTVAFGIDQKGLADNPQVLSSDSKLFSAAALQMLQHMQCKPTETPTGLTPRRHTAEIQFLIYPPCKPLPKSAQAEDVLFVVCGSVLRGTQPKRAQPD